MKSRNLFITLVVSLVFTACGKLEVEIESPTSTPTPEFVTSSISQTAEQAQLNGWIAATATALRLTAPASSATTLPPRATPTRLLPTSTLGSVSTAPVIPPVSATPVVIAPTPVVPTPVAPTRTPIPSPVTPTPDVSVAVRVITFTVTSDKDRPGPGDVVTLHWETEGGQALIGVMYGGSNSDGIGDVLPNGTMTYTLRTQDPVADHWADFSLYVSGPSGSANAQVRLHVKCWYPWFQEGLIEWCSDLPMQSRIGVAQSFEHGLMMYGTAGNYGSVVYVLFNEPGNPYRGYNALTFPVSDTSTLQPPSGLYAPAPELASVWGGEVRESTDVRARLGWATAPAAAFTSYTQCARVPDAPSPSCFVSAPGGDVFQPTMTSFLPPDASQISLSSGNYRWVETP